MVTKKTLVLDFDGVLHSYTSGWQGANVAADPPVLGASEFLGAALQNFKVCIVSSRSHQEGGKECMAHYLIRELGIHPRMIEWDSVGCEAPPGSGGAVSFMNRISFPDEKPPAHMSIDDRAFHFSGRWPSMDEIETFVPWNKSLSGAQSVSKLYAWRDVANGIELLASEYKNNPGAVPQRVLIIEEFERDEDESRPEMTLRFFGDINDPLIWRMLGRAHRALP